MPIFSNDHRRVLFLHNPKTGGVSINHIFDRAGWKVELNHWVGHHEHYASREGSLMHLTYSEISEYYNIEEFDYCFTVVRNPYDRAVSEYHWQKQHEPFNEWFTNNMAQSEQTHLPQKYHDNHFLPQINWTGEHVNVFYLEQGMDVIGKQIGEHLGVEFPRTDFHSNISNKTITVDDIDKSLVYNAYKQDFERFGYDSAR